jgi:hypothetical protein
MKRERHRHLRHQLVIMFSILPVLLNASFAIAGTFCASPPQLSRFLFLLQPLAIR